MSKKTLGLCQTPFLLSLLRTYTAANQCDILCLSETFLDSVVLFDDVNLDIPGYNLLRSATIQPMLNVAVFVFIFENLFL